MSQNKTLIDKLYEGLFIFKLIDAQFKGMPFD